MPLRIEVRNRQVVSITYADGSPVGMKERMIFAPYQTIDSIFDVTSLDIDTSQPVRADYNSTYGYPELVQVHRTANAVDDVLSLAVNDFQRLP